MDVLCNQCHWQGSKEQLVPIYMPNPKEPGDVIPVPGCPGCLTDQFLDYKEMTMTRQGKIKKETDKLIDRCYTKGSPDYPKLMVFRRQKFLNELFPLLDKLGVVIKVKCPKCGGHARPNKVTYNLHEGYRVNGHSCPNCNNTGYVAVEPLIKEV